MFLQSPRYLHQTFHPPRPLANFASSLCSTGARLGLQLLEVWRCCHSESEIALVRVHVWLKKQQSYYLRRRRAGGRKQGNKTNWIGVLLKLETVNSIPLQAAATGRSWDHGKKEKLCVQPRFWSGPEQVPPMAGADPQRHGGGRGREGRKGGTVLSCESDEVNIEVDLIGLAWVTQTSASACGGTPMCARLLVSSPTPAQTSEWFVVLTLHSNVWETDALFLYKSLWNPGHDWGSVLVVWWAVVSSSLIVQRLWSCTGQKVRPRAQSDRPLERWADRPARVAEVQRWREASWEKHLGWTGG